MTIVGRIYAGVPSKSAYRRAKACEVSRTYRAEIDGLRALAVVPVILFHAGFEAFRGGFVGVDVFFVISGYLITSIIYNEIRDGSFSIVRFYERRARRILPALIVVTVVSIPFAWVWMMPDEFQAFGESVAAVSLFSSNFFFWRNSIYFADAAELKPLLHTWSLAVEEQFYLVFPLMLLVLCRLKWAYLAGTIAIMIAASLALAELGTRMFPGATFYLLPTRAWELGIGAALALMSIGWKELCGWPAQVASALGIGMILYSVFAFDETVPFPGLWALFPVLGTALVIAYASPSNFVGKLLSVRLVVGVGLISYSAYLWHQPLFAFARIRSLHDPEPATYLVLTGVALLLAYGSWRLVEQPFRNKRRYTRTQVFSLAAVASTVVVALGAIAHFGQGLPGRVSQDVDRLMASAKDLNPRLQDCHSERDRFIAPEDSCVYGEDPVPGIALIGDSHAMSLGNELAVALAGAGHGLRELSHAGCPPFLGFYRFDREDECPRYNKLVQSYLLSRDELKTVVVVSRWTLYYDGSRFDNDEGGLERGKSFHILPNGRGREFLHDPARVNELGALHRASIERLLHSGKNVLIVYTIPEVGWDVPRHLAKERHFGIPREEALSTSYSVFKERVKEVHRQLDALPNHSKLVRVWPHRLFCNTLVPDRCVAQIGQVPLYFDDNHLNSIGASMLSEAIVAAMKESGWL
jgi:peptidoglycan/LPS O-acetylase OafA/YrhL